MKKRKKKSSKASEPKADYKKANESNEIVFFKSFQEMNEHDHRQMALHSPIERLQNMTQFIMQIYSEELKNKMTDLVIHFK